nr:hypothetical protein [Tanacetum cinerariifolium]
MSIVLFFLNPIRPFLMLFLGLNPFGCTKLTTFVVMCKAYGCETSVDLFRGFFNLCRTEGWHEWFFYVQDSIIPAKYSQLLSERNKLDSKSLKDKLPPNIEQNPMFQHLCRYPTNVRVFPHPILFLAGVKPSLEYVNTEPLKSNEEPVIQPVEVTVDSGENPKPELFVVHPGSVAARIKDWKCKTRGGLSRPPCLMMTKVDFRLPDVLELKNATTCHIKISAITLPAWKNHLDNHMDLELLDLHDRCYARQAVVDNAINMRSRELLQVIEKLRGKFDVMRNMERAREEDCEGLCVTCEAAMTEFEKNPAVVALREKIFVLSIEVKKHKLNLDRMMLESQKWAVEVSFRKEVEELKQDRREVVSKVVPYVAMKLVYSDNMGSLVGRLVSSTILYGSCRAYEQVANIKKPFELSKVKGYRSSYKKDHTQASNDFLPPLLFLGWMSSFRIL